MISFVFMKQAGNCTHFSSAVALMARTIGIPARLIGGFCHGTYDEGARLRVYRFCDAHAWIEAKIDGNWQMFEVSPPDMTPCGFGIGAAGGGFFGSLLEKIQLNILSFFLMKKIYGKNRVNKREVLHELELTGNLYEKSARKALETLKYRILG